MNFEELLNKGKIERVEKEEPDFKRCEEDIISAKHSFESEDYEWARTIAYNSVLRASIKLMAFLGYRPIGKEHHKNLFEILKECGIDEFLVIYFNKIRIKRNEFLYKGDEDTSKSEAEEAIKQAEIFVQKIRTFVQKIRTEGEK